MSDHDPSDGTPGSSEAGGGSQGDVPAVVAPLFSQDLEDFLEVVIPRLDEGLRGMRTALGDAFTLAGLTTRSSIGSLHSRDNILEVVSSVFAGTVRGAVGAVCLDVSEDWVRALADYRGGRAGPFYGGGAAAAAAAAIGSSSLVGSASTTGKVSSSRSGMQFLSDNDRREWETGKKVGFAERIALCQHLLRMLSTVRRIALLTKDITFDMMWIAEVLDTVEFELGEGVETRDEWKSVRQMGMIDDLCVITDKDKFQRLWLFQFDWRSPLLISIADFQVPTAVFSFTPHVSTRSGKRFIHEAVKNFCSAISVYMGIDCTSASEKLVETLGDVPRMEGIHDIYVFCKVNKAISRVTHEMRTAVALETTEAQYKTFIGAAAFVDRLKSALDAVATVMPKQGATADFTHFYSGEYKKIAEWPKSARTHTVLRDIAVAQPSPAPSLREGGDKVRTERNKRKAEKRKLMISEGRRVVEESVKRQVTPSSYNGPVRAEDRRPVEAAKGRPHDGLCPFHVAQALKVTKTRGGQEILACHYASQPSCQKGLHLPLNGFTRSQILASLNASLDNNKVIKGLVQAAVTAAPSGTFKEA